MKSAHVSFGAWTHGLRDTETGTVHPEALTKFQSQIGKDAAIAHIYVGWHELETAAFRDNLDDLADNYWTPMVSSNPYFFIDCKPEGLSLYATIAGGRCNTFLRKAARNMAAFKHPILFRFAWEMNIPANEWSLDYTQSTSEDFIAAWRHIHDIFVEEKAENVIWVFCPFVKSAETHEFEHMYPGDAYVGWVGLDGYNWGATQSWSRWQNFNEVFYVSYKKLQAIAPSKPVLIGEFGSTDIGGDKAEWFTDMLSVELSRNFPGVKAIVFYNEDRTEKENVDWTLTETSPAMDAVRKSIRNRMYSSAFEPEK